MGRLLERIKNDTLESRLDVKKRRTEVPRFNSAKEESDPNICEGKRCPRSQAVGEEWNLKRNDCEGSYTMIKLGALIAWAGFLTVRSGGRRGGTIGGV